MNIEIVFFDPHYWIFSFGISLNRYEEYTADYTQFRVRKELEVGFIVMSLRFNFNYPQPVPEKVKEE